MHYENTEGNWIHLPKDKAKQSIEITNILGFKIAIWKY